MKKVKIVLLLIISSLSLSYAAESEKSVCIGNKVNFRSSPEKLNNIILQCNIGDIVEVVEIVEIVKHEVNIEKPSDYWVKVRFNQKVGYINANYLTSNFVIVENTLVWAQIQYFDGVTNPYKVVSYDLKKKEVIKSVNMNFTDIAFSSNRKYFALDSGSDAIRDLEFYESTTLNKIYSFTYEDTDFKWNGNKFTFNNYVKNDSNSYYLEETVFDNGTIFQTGKRKLMKIYQ